VSEPRDAASDAWDAMIAADEVALEPEFERDGRRSTDPEGGQAFLDRVLPADERKDAIWMAVGGILLVAILGAVGSSAAAFGNWIANGVGTAFPLADALGFGLRFLLAAIAIMLVLRVRSAPRTFPLFVVVYLTTTAAGDALFGLVSSVLENVVMLGSPLYQSSYAPVFPGLAGDVAVILGVCTGALIASRGLSAAGTWAFLGWQSDPMPAVVRLALWLALIWIPERVFGWVTTSVEHLMMLQSAAGGSLPTGPETGWMFLQLAGVVLWGVVTYFAVWRYAAPRSVWLLPTALAAVSLVYMPFNAAQLLQMYPGQSPGIFLEFLFMAITPVLSAALALYGVHLATREDDATMGAQFAEETFAPEPETVGGHNG